MVRGSVAALILLTGVGAVVLFRPVVDRDATPAAEVRQELRAEPRAPTGGADSSVTAPTQRSTPPPSVRAAIELKAPDTVPGGTEFALAVEIAGRVAGQGWIELSFDPGVLTLADASVGFDSSGPGVVRLQVEKLEAHPYSASLQFVSSFGAQAPALVQVTGGELVSAEGRVIGLTLPAAARIVVAPP